MLLDAKSLCEAVDRPNIPENVALAIPASRLYGETIGWIKTNREALAEALALPKPTLTNRVLQGDQLAAFVLSSENSVRQVLKVDDSAFDLGLKPKAKLKADDIQARAHALETARIFFTRILKMQVGEPFRFSITATSSADKSFAL